MTVVMSTNLCLLSFLVDFYSELSEITWASFFFLLLFCCCVLSVGLTESCRYKEMDFLLCP